MLALTHALRSMGKVAVPLSAHGVPEIYRWMPGQEWIQTPSSQGDDMDFDLGIICDTGGLERIGSKIAPYIASARITMKIDHHLTEGDFGDIRVVNSHAAATGELIYELLREMGASFSQEIAECLLCAIITDTGSFRFMNVTPNTFRISGALMRCGACPAAISELVFESRSFASIKLLGRALDSLKLSDDGRVAHAVLHASDFLELNATDEETEGIVNHVRSVRGAQVGVLFREVPGCQIRISIRSREGYDVNRVAQVFGGGGHKLAAGCSFDPPIENAVRTVLDEIHRGFDDPAPGQKP
jgi:phosphoesterase RecJ-like protein